MAHLYEGCRQAGYLKQIWPDLELVMDILTREQIFVGRVPQTPKESSKCLQLMLGVSPVNFARNSRLNRIKVSNKNGKKFSLNSPVMEMFGMQWMKSGDPTLTVSNVEDLLNDRRFASTFNNITTAQKRDQSLLQRQWAKSHKMTPLQLLDTLHHAIAAEEHIIRFDYISLHLRCRRILCTLQTVHEDTLRRYIGRNGIEKNTHLAFVVLYIFLESAESDRSILKRASETLHKFIEREGSVECDRLKEICVCWSRREVSYSESERSN